MLAPFAFFALAAIAAPASPAPPPAAPAPGVTRTAAVAFGETVQVAVADLPAEAVRAATEAALAEIRDIEALTDPRRGALAELNAAAGKGARPIDRRLALVLAKADQFCDWSEKAHGPLGRDLYALWGLRAAAPMPPPDPGKLDAAVAAAACDKLTVDTRANTATLAAGSAIDLWGFAQGLAVDRTVEVLRQRGVRNALVRVGGVYRGFGRGLAGRGWPVLVSIPGLEGEASHFLLRDRALAVATARDHPLRIASEELTPYLNQRTGRPAEGMVGVLAATELAVDAQGMVVTQMIIGPHEGQLRLGALQPRPAVLWLQGSGAGNPLLIEYHWSEVPKR